MQTSTALVLLAQLPALVFATAALFSFSGPRAVRTLLADWGYAPGFHRTIGNFTMVAAILLAIPQIRIWGVILAASISLVSSVVFVNHRKYLYAMPGILVFAVLPFALAGTSLGH
jgi:hypothetical protein